MQTSVNCGAFRKATADLELVTYKNMLCASKQKKQNRFFERLRLHTKLLTRSIYSHSNAGSVIVLHVKLCKTKQNILPLLFLKVSFFSCCVWRAALYCGIILLITLKAWQWYLACLYRMYHCFYVQLWVLLLKNNYCSMMIIMSSHNFKTLKWCALRHTFLHTPISDPWHTTPIHRQTNSL